MRLRLFDWFILPLMPLLCVLVLAGEIERWFRVPDLLYTIAKGLPLVLWLQGLFSLMKIEPGESSAVRAYFRELWYSIFFTGFTLPIVWGALVFYALKDEWSTDSYEFRLLVGVSCLAMLHAFIVLVICLLKRRSLR